MYSPKIKPVLVQRLYVLARNRRIPMTRIVNKIIEDYLERCPLRQPTDGRRREHKRGVCCFGVKG